MTTLAMAMQSFATATFSDKHEGLRDTALKGVSFYHASQPIHRQPLLYQSGIIIMGQGHKNIQLGKQNLDYGAGDYLVIGVPLPLESEAFTDNGKAVLSLCVDIDLAQLLSLVDELKFISKPPASPSCGLQLAQLNAPLENACIRLLQCLQNNNEMAIFGQDIVKEILYHALTGPQGNTLMGLVQQDSQYAKIARVLDKLHGNYAQTITVDDMAAQANMSVSAFHRVFKKVTLESPMQYLKKVRLNKAKDLISFHGKRACDAGLIVGYSSNSQFFREFKRQFKCSPASFLP